VKPLEFNPAAKETLCRLCERFPGTPFLALGQTVFWDEPTKAFFVQMLRECVPQAEFWHGIHDTDYFSRLPRPLSGPRPFALVEHNDSSTRGLWVAMCEASRLFGAEVLPTRAILRHYGCNLAKAQAHSRPFSLDEVTCAWGWKGIVSTGERELVARDVLLSDLVEELSALTREAVEGTAEAIADSAVRKEALRIGEEMVNEVRQFAQRHSAATLAQLYLHLLSRFYQMLLGEAPPNLRLTSSSSLFRFNPQTAGERRFAPVGLFLNPQTRPLARCAYDDAVAGSGIYTLEHFGPDAIPFDLVVPGRGRGTVCVTPTEIIIHTPEHIYLPAAGPIENTVDLAKAVSKHLGEEVALVGKAVMLIPMIAQEFILVFHEGASAYTEHTHEFVDFLEREGISLNCHPILRLCHNAWEALRAVKGRLRLPPHLAEAFSRNEVSGEEFAFHWKEAVECRRSLLQSLAQAKKPAALLEFFFHHFSDDGDNGEIWRDALGKYQEARQILAQIGREILAGQQRASRLREDAYHLRQEMQRLEKEKGRHFREVLKPQLPAIAPEAEATRRALQEEIGRKRDSLASIREELRQVKEEQRRSEERTEFVQARQTALRLEGQGERERLRLVRNAVLTTGDLEQTNRRPTGWWFPLVSPGGEWFRELARTSTLSVEAFCPEP